MKIIINIQLLKNQISTLKIRLDKLNLIYRHMIVLTLSRLLFININYFLSRPVFYLSVENNIHYLHIESYSVVEFSIYL